MKIIYSTITWKTTTKKGFSITIDEHLNFNKHITIISKSANIKLNAMLRVLSPHSYQQKKFGSNSLIWGQFIYYRLIWMLSSIWSHRNSTNYMKGLSDCQNDYNLCYNQWTKNEVFHEGFPSWKTSFFVQWTNFWANIHTGNTQ